MSFLIRLDFGGNNQEKRNFRIHVLTITKLPQMSNEKRKLNIQEVKVWTGTDVNQSFEVYNPRL